MEPVLEPVFAAPLLSLLARGGWVMGVLALLSLGGLTIVLVKLQQFVRLRIWSRAWIEGAVQALRRGDTDAALATARSTPGPIAKLLTIALEEKARRDLSPEALREEVQRAGEAELSALESNLRGLEVIGTLAPLLGLLGTVLGMIRAFMRLEEAGARVDPSLLSGGIWEALLTTAVGIAVAIPAMAALAWLESQVDRVRHCMSDVVTRALHARTLHADAEQPPSGEQSHLRPADGSRAVQR